jgi:hypothetical protein
MEGSLETVLVCSQGISYFLQHWCIHKESVKFGICTFVWTLVEAKICTSKASTSVQFRPPPTVQMPNIALIETKRIAV